MTNPHLDQAKEWADHHAHTELVLEGSAARVIRSLPDSWVDAEKVREEADRMDKGAENSMKPGRNEFSRGYAEAMQECAEHLRNLIAPPPPPLADMTPEEREKYVGMFCQFNGDSELGATVEDYELGVYMGDAGAAVLVMFPGRKDAEGRVFAAHQIDLRHDLPRLEWPGSGDVPTVAEQENVAPDQQVNPQVNLDSSLPRPEDVPAGEPWLILRNGHEWVGTRESSEKATWPWSLARLDGVDYGMARDSAITLVSRLVPEVAP